MLDPSVSPPPRPSPRLPDAGAVPSLAQRLDRLLAETDAVDGVRPDPAAEALARAARFTGPVLAVVLEDGTRTTLAIVRNGERQAGRALRRAARARGLVLHLVPERRVAREERRRLDVVLSACREALPAAAEVARLTAMVRAAGGTVPFIALAEAVGEADHPIQAILAMVAHGYLDLDASIPISPGMPVALNIDGGRP